MMSSQGQGSQTLQRRSKTSQLTERERLRVVQLKAGGDSHRTIAQKVGCSNSTVSALIRKVNEEGTIRDKERTGRPRKTTMKDDRYIALLAKQDPCQTSKQIADTVSSGVASVSHYTVLRRLKEKGIRSRIQRSKPLLTRVAARRRLAFAKQYGAMPIEFWQKVILLHLWDELDRLIPQSRRKQMKDFESALQEHWYLISRERIEKLICSMPDRLKAVIEAKGYYTRY